MRNKHRAERITFIHDVYHNTKQEHTDAASTARQLLTLLSPAGVTLTQARSPAAVILMHR